MHSKLKYYSLNFFKVLNWDNLGLTVPFVTIGLFIILPIVHSLLWGLHQLRDYVLLDRIIKRKSSLDISTDGQSNPVFELA